MKRSSPLRRTGRLRQVGARAKREAAALALFRRAVLERAGGRCERCGKAGRLHAHHIRPRSRGGKHELANGAALCPACHGSTHDHTAPDWRRWVA